MLTAIKDLLLHDIFQLHRPRQATCLSMELDICLGYSDPDRRDPAILGSHFEKKKGQDHSGN